MKNLHVLPTDHPSRLRYNIKTRIWELNEFHKYHTDIKSTHNIYITSEEEIKEGDYVVQINFEKTNTQVIKCETEFQTKIANSKDGSFSKNKIILTTDSYLIKDGVQEINDTFLEWFCSKNGKVGYIESKQGRTCTNNCSVVCGECQIFDKKPITNLEKLLFPELVTELAGYYKNTQLVEEPKQELDCPYNFTSRCTIGRCDCKPKEVVEKTTKMYSEEEVLFQLNLLYSMKNSLVDTFTDEEDRITMKWFNQFKCE